MRGRGSKPRHLGGRPGERGDRGGRRSLRSGIETRKRPPLEARVTVSYNVYNYKSYMTMTYMYVYDYVRYVPCPRWRPGPRSIVRCRKT